MQTTIEQFGARADEGVNNAAAIQAAIDAVNAAGGGTVLVPAGRTFLTGSIRLQSNVCLHLESGARLLASPRIEDYWNLRDDPLFREADFGHFWIHAVEADNVAITGIGELNGNLPAFITERRPENTVARNPRAQSVAFFGCRNVRVRDVTIRDAPSWALRPAGCNNVVIDGVSIISDTGLVNTDGIDPDCSKNVRISNCFIETGDDGICLKTRREIAGRYGTCENVAITNCIVRSSCIAIRIGTESCADIRNVVVSNCVVFGSHRGLAIDGRDPAVIENVLFNNLTVETRLSHPVWWHEGEPIYICQLPRPGTTRAATVRDVRFTNIAINAESGVYVQGDTQTPPEDLLFENVRLRIRRNPQYAAGRFDPRPCDPDFLPTGSKGVAERTPWGSLARHDTPAFYFDRARGVTLRHCEVDWEKDLPDCYSHALEAHHVEGLRVENPRWESAHPDRQPAVVQTSEL